MIDQPFDAPEFSLCSLVGCKFLALLLDKNAVEISGMEISVSIWGIDIVF